MRKTHFEKKFPIDTMTMGYGEGEIELNASRRYINEEGVCQGKLNPEGIYDHRVKVLGIHDGNTLEPMAVSMHAHVMQTYSAMQIRRHFSN